MVDVRVQNVENTIKIGRQTIGHDYINPTTIYVFVLLQSVSAQFLVDLQKYWF